MILKVGDPIPNFIAKKQDGSLFDSQTVVGLQPVVIYFYPKDDTQVCTQQACAFRDQYEDFKTLGAEVIGVSGDGVKSHKKFTDKYKLPFVLISDEDKVLRHLFGVPKSLLGLLPGRVTYVADKNGIIRMIFNSLSGRIHIDKALQTLKNL
jgi:peroxiredoxin Q/BCP